MSIVRVDFTNIVKLVLVQLLLKTQESLDSKIV